MNGNPEIEALAHALTQPMRELAESLKKIADSAARNEQHMRLTLALFAAAIAMQPSVDPRRLLADFDRLLEKNASHDEQPPMVAMDVRSTIAKVIAAIDRKE